LVVAVAPITAHSMDNRSSSDTIGRLADVYDGDSAASWYACCTFAKP
jgi:hypothetical protein